VIEPPECTFDHGNNPAYRFLACVHWDGWTVDVTEFLEDDRRPYAVFGPEFWQDASSLEPPSSWFATLPEAVAEMQQRMAELTQ
jgi:hypothetical protein